MRIVIGNDHAAVGAKTHVMQMLRGTGHVVEDVGTNSEESTDYPIQAEAVARRVAEGTADIGILLCGSGIGMSIAANKVRGIRAALCYSEETARLAREHNDANVLCLGARLLPIETIEKITQVFLAGAFAGGRHARRVERIKELESRMPDRP